MFLSKIHHLSGKAIKSNSSSRDVYAICISSLPMWTVVLENIYDTLYDTLYVQYFINFI